MTCNDSSCSQCFTNDDKDVSPMVEQIQSLEERIFKLERLVAKQISNGHDFEKRITDLENLQAESTIKSRYPSILEVVEELEKNIKCFLKNSSHKSENKKQQ